MYGRRGAQPPIPSPYRPKAGRGISPMQQEWSSASNITVGDHLTDNEREQATKLWWKGWKTSQQTVNDMIPTYSDLNPIEPEMLKRRCKLLGKR